MRFTLLFQILFLTLIILPTHAGLRKYLENADLKEEIKAEIAELDIGFNVDIFDLNITEGIGIATGYRYEVEPSYINDWYSRIDKWVLNTNLRPGDFLKDADLPISINVDNGLEVLFVRQFKTRKEAMTAIPYTFAKLPLKAELARKNLKPGDFVSLPARLNIVVSAGLGVTEGIVRQSANTHYLLSGEFQIHIFRMKDDKVRIKIIALRKRQKGADVSTDLDFKIFGIGIVDRRIKKLIDMNLAKLDWNKQTGNLFLMDFVYDLKDPKSRKAYNQILSSTYKFKNMKILNPFQSHREIEDQLISDLTMTEELFYKDREKSQANRRVDRVFKGSNEFENKKSGYKIGFNIAKFSKEQTYSENQITYVDRKDKKHHFFFPTHTVVKERKLLFGFSRTSKIMNYFALWPTNAQGQSLDESRRVQVLEGRNGSDDILVQELPPIDAPEGESPDFKDFGMSVDMKNKRSWGWEQREFKEYLQRNIPGFIYDQIPWGDWEEEKKRFNARYFFQVIIHKVAIGNLARTTRGSLHKKMDAYMETIPLPRVVDSGGHKNHGPKPTWQSQHAWSIRKTVKGLDQALSMEHVYSDRERIQKLIELRKHEAFQELGAGFMISLMDHRKLPKHISITLHMSAKDTQTLTFQFGEHELQELYKELQYVQGVMNNRSFDMRLMKEEDPGATRVGISSMEDPENQGEEGESPEIYEGALNDEGLTPEVSDLID